MVAESALPGVGVVLVLIKPFEKKLVLHRLELIAGKTNGLNSICFSNTIGNVFDLSNRFA